MKKKIVSALWVFFYLICALISNVEQPDASQSVALTVLSLIFFVPPLILLVDALRDRDRKTLFILRLLSILSLTLTLGALIGNIAIVGASETVGIVLHQVLIFVSVPMVCSQHYALSMFLWGCLLFATLPGVILKKK